MATFDLARGQTSLDPHAAVKGKFSVVLLRPKLIFRALTSFCRIDIEFSGCKIYSRACSFGLSCKTISSTRDHPTSSSHTRPATFRCSRLLCLEMLKRGLWLLLIVPAVLGVLARPGSPGRYPNSRRGSVQMASNGEEWPLEADADATMQRCSSRTLLPSECCEQCCEPVSW